ncbi:MAG: phenylalanine--tRNA ligase subunit beta [Candidatus Aenigmatarchaeota archaeon]
MVVVEISKQDLLNLIGKELTNKELENNLFLLKIESKISNDAIECELNPDRPDMFSVEGIARALKTFLRIDHGIPKYDVADSKVVLNKEKAEVRPEIACGIVKNIELTDELVKSLMQIQEKLHMTIGRDRKKVAIGVHDYDKIRPPLVYKDVEDIKFIPLQETKEMSVKEILEKHPKGRDYAHLVKDKYPMILDQEGVISFPPIINSERTKVTKNTKNLFIDVTGTDEKAVNQVLNIMVCNIAERGGKIRTVKVSRKKTPNLEPEKLTIDVEYIDNLLGLGLNENEIKEFLERMGFGVTKYKGGKINVLIPGFRSDILHAVDIIEDVAIGYGYDKIEPVLPKIATIGSLSKIEKFSTKIRELMIGLGFQEVMNFVLSNKENNFNKMNISEDAIEILNPVSSEYNICRTWILPSLMKVLAANKHREYPQKIFEIGDVILINQEQETKANTIRKISGVISYDNANLTEMKSIVETVLKNLGCKCTIKEYNHSSFIETRIGEIFINEDSVGFFGEIHPEILNNWRLEKPVIAFEIDIEKLI